MIEAKGTPGYVVVSESTAQRLPSAWKLGDVKMLPLDNSNKIKSYLVKRCRANEKMLAMAKDEYPKLGAFHRWFFQSLQDIVTHSPDEPAMLIAKDSRQLVQTSSSVTRYDIMGLPHEESAFKKNLHGLHGRAEENLSVEGDDDVDVNQERCDEVVIKDTNGKSIEISDVPVTQASSFEMKAATFDGVISWCEATDLTDGGTIELDEFFLKSFKNASKKPLWPKEKASQQDDARFFFKREHGARPSQAQTGAGDAWKTRLDFNQAIEAERRSSNDDQVEEKDRRSPNSHRKEEIDQSSACMKIEQQLAHKDEHRDSSYAHEGKGKRPKRAKPHAIKVKTHSHDDGRSYRGVDEIQWTSMGARAQSSKESGSEVIKRSPAELSDGSVWARGGRRTGMKSRSLEDLKTVLENASQCFSPALFVAPSDLFLSFHTTGRKARREVQASGFRSASETTQSSASSHRTSMCTSLDCKCSSSKTPSENLQGSVSKSPLPVSSTSSPTTAVPNQLSSCQAPTSRGSLAKLFSNFERHRALFEHQALEPNSEILVLLFLSVRAHAPALCVSVSVCSCVHACVHLPQLVSGKGSTLPLCVRVGMLVCVRANLKECVLFLFSVAVQ